MSPIKPLLICIVGPTAIGKTSMAIEIAEAFSTEIISADSRQFYKEIKIGTAVPSVAELNKVPHYFIQNKSIFDNYSVGDFEKEALQLLDELFLKYSVVVMAGGSGLYVEAVARGLDKFPDVASEIREKLNEELKTNGIRALQKELQAADPAYFEKADIQNPHRIIRALEIYRSSGLPYSSFLKKGDSKRAFDIMYIGLSADREIIYDRINTRVDKMIEDGLVEEARTIYPNRELNALQTVGYRELFEYFDGNLSKDNAIAEIKKNTRRFAKRQGTWFRKNQKISWFDYNVSPSTIISFIKEKNAL